MDGSCVASEDFVDRRAVDRHGKLAESLGDEPVVMALRAITLSKGDPCADLVIHAN